VYYYQVSGSTRTPSFLSSRTSGDAAPFTFLMVGDMGLVNSEDTIKQMTLELSTVDFIHHVGDLSYADDWKERHDTYEGAWNKWQEEMDPITSTRAYMVLPGNHEATCTESDPSSCATATRNFTAYRNRFRMPWMESGGIDNMWYSYEYGTVHFTQIDTETDYPHSPEGQGSEINAGPFGNQLEWLESDLAAANNNRDNVPWIIVSGHRPLYSSGSGQCNACQEAFEALFNKYNVDLVLAGHVHWYERLWPLGPGGNITQENYDNPPVPIYFVNGAAGNVEGHTTGKAKPMTAYVDDKDYGYSRATVYNSTTLLWQFFHASDNTLGDQVTIYKEH